MDSHDTNLPLNEGKLEEEKKQDQVSEATSSETLEESNVEKKQEEPSTENEALVSEEKVAEEVEETESSATIDVETSEESDKEKNVEEKEIEENNIIPQETVQAETQQPEEVQTVADTQTETVKDEPAQDKAEESVEEAAPIKQQTKEEILARVKEIVKDAESAEKQEIDALKQAFYKQFKTEQEAAKKAFIDEGGQAEDYKPVQDDLEVEFKALMNVIREKRGALMAEQEKQKEENLAVKLQIIEKLKDLVSRPDEANKAYNEFKKLQQQWNEIKLIPAGKINELWKSYQHYVEKFYDIIKLNNEFRDYDFKKNLEIKTHLCIAAEKLADEPDVISAFHQLQKLHQEFRDTGPVAKELRDEIWGRFKAASTVVNRKHQQHFEGLKENEQRNLDEKTVICEIVEATEYDELKTFTDWENKTQEIIALQAKWKTIGFAPQKMNVKIFERFRAACDDFFKKKADFYKSIKEKMNENLEKKRLLCEKAESLKDSTDWKETADMLTKIQKEWKAIGPVPKKYSDIIWKRFIGACDYFFEQKNKATSSQRVVEQENLEKKKEIIQKLENFDETLGAEEAESQIREIMNEWGQIGHVPFREKDKIYKQYHSLIDKHFERLHINASARRLSNFRSNISNVASQGDRNSSQALYREREKLGRIYENMKNEILTYENNLGFLSSSSKKGNSLVAEITRKVDKLKAELELVLKKIEVIDETIKNQD